MIDSSCGVIDGVEGIGSVALGPYFNLIHCSIKVLKYVGTIIQFYRKLFL